MHAAPETLATTMRTLIGVDSDGLYLPAVDLLGRLGFRGNRAILAHTERPAGPQFQTVPLVYEFPTAPEIDATLRLVGRTLLEEGAESTRDAGLGDEPKTIYRLGNTAATLMSLADEERADLVAIGARHHTPLGCFLLGSVGRAFAIGGRQSFLVARNKPKGSGPLRAVFATDHSNYADRCFNRLLDMDPQGLGHVTVVTATESIVDRMVSGETGYSDRSAEAFGDYERELRRLGRRLVERLEARGISADFRLVESYPEEAVRTTMEETGADLLILGARGHGIMERVLIGSLALHEVVAEPHSVLVLRLPEAC